MPLIIPLNTISPPDLAQVGGKGYSLIQMSQHGLPVPPGFVLPLAFFQGWLEQIQKTAEWSGVLSGVLSSPPTELQDDCDQVKRMCLRLELDAKQRAALAAGLDYLSGEAGAGLLAVRSSSPEEDLEGASFAGGYETSLGVQAADLETAIKRSFASCFDERVLLYKREHGYALGEPRIAVIVQQQVAADSSGVAFSLNPANNCYDEAVVNANYGLGESVVAGLVTPDTFIIDKVNRVILEKKLGKKEKAVRLTAGGGTYQEVSTRGPQFCLTDEEVLAVTDMVSRVESLYGKPVDVEWAFAESHLHLLQARPVTAYIPLPEAMQTEPGAPRMLYIDLTMYKQGINKPLSVMGLDHWERIQKAVAGSDVMFGIKDGLMFNTGGRTYSNLSYGLKLQSKEKTAAAIRIQDALSAEIVENVDDSYRAARLPSKLKGVLLKIATRRIGTFVSAIKAYLHPQKQHQRFLDETRQLENSLAALAARVLAPGQLAQASIDLFGDYMANISLPVTIAAEIARARIKRAFSQEAPQVQEQVHHLDSALPHNITIEMGLELYRLSQFAEIRPDSSAAEFLSQLDRGTLSPSFMDAWQGFMQKHGLRCPLELDIATPRSYETAAVIYKQLQTMAANQHDETNPQAIYDRSVAQRETAYLRLQEIASRRGKRYARKFKHYYDVLLTFGGYRENFKYYIIVVVDMFRRRVLAEARSLMDAGRLDRLEQVFDLHISELDEALADPRLDLRELAQENTRFLKKLARVRQFPLVIDSRGKILRPPKKEMGAGEVVGQPIAAGRVRGTVKVLTQPDEKPVLPGEILVARATDPGWTPLFLNAAGIILEVGGILQHGAVVAREYGKPCVAAIENATALFQDGQWVELDGARGLVTILSGNGRQAPQQ